MRLLKCDKHKNTMIASDETVLHIFKALLTDPLVTVWKIQRCDCGGWHIFLEGASEMKDIKFRGIGYRLGDHQKIDLKHAFNNLYEMLISSPNILDGSRPYHNETLKLKELFDNIGEWDIVFLKKEKT